MAADPEAPHALIVSRNSYTTKGLRAYFDQRGVATTVIDRLEAALGDAQFTAIVMFPDEFPVEGAIARIDDLAGRFSRARIVVVTRHTTHFDKLVTASSARNLSRLLVLPRPVWGWDLLDRVLQQPPPANTDT